MKSQDIIIADDALIKNVESSYSLSETSHKCFGADSRRRDAYIKQKITELNLDVSHWTGRRGNGKLKERRYTDEEVFCKDTKVSNNHVRRRVIADNLLKEQCSECGLNTEWNNKPLVLHLDHINGVKTDCRLENLRFLCPNCHQQTETWGTKNFNKKIKMSKQELYELSKTKTNRDLARELGVHESHISRLISEYYRKG